MASNTQTYELTTSSQVVVTVDNVTQYVTLHSEGNTYVGDSSVTDENGIHIGNDATLQLTLPQGCDLYGVAASGTHTLRVLITRVD